MDDQTRITTQLEMVALRGLEREFLDAVPDEFKLGAYTAYKRWLSDQNFNSNIEGSKAKLAYMDAFVTAVFMTQKDGGEQNDQSGETQPDNAECDSPPPPPIQQ